MEAQQPQQNQQPTEQSSKGAGTSSFLCRQTSARWTPTSDQIRILKELYYNNGVRSPSSEQIQKISARLRQYGKIEGKNVFYWFQNHKARERQKKRFTTTPTDHLPTPTSIPMQRPSLENAAAWKPDQDSLLYNKYPGVSSSSSSSPGMRTVGPMGSFGYGAVTMENNFRDCSISAGGSGGGNRSHNLGWDPYSSTYTLYNKRMSNEEDDEEDNAPEIETLPLFPMHGEDYNGCFYNTTNNKQPESDRYYNGWYRSDNGNHTSLELSLNSYTGRSMN